MNSRLLRSLMLPVALSACAAQGKSDGPGPAPKPSGNDIAVSFLTPGAEAYQELTKTELLPVGTDEKTANLQTAGVKDPVLTNLVALDAKTDLYKVCGAIAPKGKASGIDSIIGWAIQEVGGWIVDGLDSALQDQIKKYSLTLTAKASGIDLYNKMSAGSGLDASPAAICFRVTQRGPATPGNSKSATTVLMDFVGVVRYDPTVREMLSVEPLRLFLQRIDVPTDDGKVAVNVKLSADVTQRLQYQGTTTAGVINASLASEVIDTSGLSGAKPFYKFYAKQAPNYIALPPWDYNATPAVPKDHYLAASVTITEVGNVPWLLKEAATLLDKNKDSVTKDLVGAAQKAAGVSGQ